MSTYTYHEVLNQVQHLSPDEQFQLVEDVLALLRHKIAAEPQQEKAPEPLHSILELRGLGKEVWAGIDVDQYIEQERNSWDG